MLEDAGLSADMAVNGEVAVSMAGAAPYDLILMDMQMPVMDGLDATMAIRRLPGYAETPIIALTANAFSEDRDRCMAAGMDDFISKPVRPDLLLPTLRKWLRKDGGVASHASENMPTPPPVTKPQDGSESTTFGLDELLDHLDGNRDQAKRLIMTFQETFATTSQELERLFDWKRLAHAEHLAHALKGAAAVLAAHAVYKATGDLEAALRSLPSLVRDVKASLDTAMAAIPALTDDLDRKHEPRPARSTAPLFRQPERQMPTGYSRSCVALSRRI